MSEKKVRFAVVGLKSIGNAYVAAINRLAQGEVTAICECNEDMAKKRAAEYGMDKYYTDFYEMIKDGGFDCVVLGTPDQVHMDHSVAALEAGYHVICEKPLALTMEECEKIVEATRKSDKKFMTGQVARKTPSFIKVKELIENKIFENQSLSDICRSLGYSKSYLSRLFREQTGETMGGFAMRCRIGRAGQLIREGEYNFAEISDLLAFENPQYFSRVFKRITKMTPTEYRLTVHRSHPSEDGAPQ
jgi:AraC-like DNA-binding protein